VATGIDKDELMHNRFVGHAGAKRIKAAFKTSGYAHKHDPKDCESCKLNMRAGKNKNKTSATGTVYTYFGDCITSDAVGLFESSLINSHKYAVCFYDRATCYPAVYFLKGKDSESESVLRALKLFMTDFKVKAELKHCKTPGPLWTRGTATTAPSSRRTR